MDVGETPSVTIAKGLAYSLQFFAEKRQIRCCWILSVNLIVCEPNLFFGLCKPVARID